MAQAGCSQLPHNPQAEAPSGYPQCADQGYAEAVAGDCGSWSGDLSARRRLLADPLHEGGDRIT